MATTVVPPCTNVDDTYGGHYIPGGWIIMSNVWCATLLSLLAAHADPCAYQVNDHSAPGAAPRILWAPTPGSVPPPSAGPEPIGLLCVPPSLSPLSPSAPA